MIEIEPARLQDIPELREVAIASYRDTFTEFNTPENMEAFLSTTYSLAKLQEEFQEPNSWIFIAWENKQQVGFIRLRETDEVEHTLGKQALELQRLYVLTQAHGKSVGRKLMEVALAFANDRSYQWIWLGVWERNYRAQEFYAKWGFVRFSEHTFMMGDDPQVDWLLCKKLRD